MNSPVQEKKKILLIDDEQIYVTVMRSALELEGFEVVTASDGKEGVAKALGEKPNMILLDLNMPRQGGYTTLRALKQNVQTCRIPVIIVTVKGESVSQAAAENMGAVDYVIKPFKAEVLLESIRRNL